MQVDVVGREHVQLLQAAGGVARARARVQLAQGGARAQETAHRVAAARCQLY